MKKLLFDDYQAVAGGKFVVREVGDEEEGVMPSMKTGQSVPMVKPEHVPEFEVSDFFDLDDEKQRADIEPRGEFNSLLGKVLRSIQEVLFAHTVAFFWVNRDKQQLVLEKACSLCGQLGQPKRIPLGNDVLSKVAETGKPHFVGQLNQHGESEMIPYYDGAESIHSLVVVPVFYPGGAGNNLPVGVLVVDSKAPDAFGFETVSALGNFTKLVSSLIQGYTGKYDLLVDSELLASIQRMFDRVKSEPSEHTILECLGEEANRLVHWERLSVVLYDEGRNGWVVQSSQDKIGDGFTVDGLQIDFPSSITGKAIASNSVQTTHDLSTHGGVRFRSGEPEGVKSFMAVPVSSINRCYGALTLESRSPAAFSGKDVETIYRLAETSASLLEVIYMNDLVKDYVIVDQLTGSFKKKHFLKKVDEEVQRASDLGDELSLVSISVDDLREYREKYGPGVIDSILHRIARVVRSEIRVYDSLGRLDGEALGVLLANTTASDAYVWAEKLRKRVASEVIVANGASFSVTMSSGVCGVVDGMETAELFSASLTVLHKAEEAGGNAVRVY